MSGPPSHFVKIFGERNSGTRAVTQMVRKVKTIHTCRERPEANSPHTAEDDFRDKIGEYYGGKWRRLYDEALTDQLSCANPSVSRWKHAVVAYDESFVSAKASVMFCVRNPYSWAIALAKRPYHRKGPQAESFDEFVDRPWLTVGREHAPAVVRSPLALWNLKYASYLNFTNIAAVPNTMVRFEDFIADPVPYLVDKMESVGLPTGGVAEIEKSTKDDRSLDDIRNYYIEEKWRSWLSAPVVEAINRHIDWNIALYFGYGPLQPNDFPAEVSPAAKKEMGRWFADPRSKNSSRSRSWPLRLGFRW